MSNYNYLKVLVTQICLRKVCLQILFICLNLKLATIFVKNATFNMDYHNSNINIPEIYEN